MTINDAMKIWFDQNKYKSEREMSKAISTCLGFTKRKLKKQVTVLEASQYLKSTYKYK